MVFSLGVEVVNGVRREGEMNLVRPAEVAERKERKCGG